MKIWSFIFTEPKDGLSSARVAAKDRTGAILQMQDLLNQPMTAQMFQPPGPGVILQWMGEDADEVSPRVISVVSRDGRQLVAAR